MVSRTSAVVAPLTVSATPPMLTRRPARFRATARVLRIRSPRQQNTSVSAPQPTSSRSPRSSRRYDALASSSKPWAGALR